GDVLPRLRAGGGEPESAEESLALAAPATGSNAVALAGHTLGAVDVVFPVLHGPFGEDGTVQGMLELAGLPYVGSGVLGSALGMDKIAMKAVFASYGLPVGPYVAVMRHEWEQDPAGVQQRAEAALTYPMFAKPANLGSSVGISKIHEPDEFAGALTRAARYDRRLLIEQGLDAREIECSVLGNEAPRASVCGEIAPRREFYDFRAKYLDNTSDLIIPADLPVEVSERVRALAVAAFQAVDAAGLARVDFFVRRGDDAVFVNEINTLPGFTAISMYPKLWEASGLTYAELVSRLIDLALARHADRRRPPSPLDDDEDARTIAGELPV
ncbi:MAG TPA: D-alanine--D-alanine ligase family protein, partial [Chloroflexia bacterium]|nr:D-alanine--D-alanine ligase family protein [Chloroflexia bacterium]